MFEEYRVVWDVWVTPSSIYGYHFGAFDPEVYDVEVRAKYDTAVETVTFKDQGDRIPLSDIQATIGKLKRRIIGVLREEKKE